MYESVRVFVSNIVSRYRWFPFSLPKYQTSIEPDTVYDLKCCAEYKIYNSMCSLHNSSKLLYKRQIHSLSLHAHIHTYATSVHIHSNTYARHITINRECVHACTIVVESLSCGGLSLVWLFADTDSDFIQLFFYLSGINNAHNTFTAKRVVIDTLSESTTPTTAAKIKIPFRTQIVFA